MLLRFTSRRRWFVPALLVGVSSLLVSCAPSPPESSPSWPAPLEKLLDAPETRALVLVFVDPDCPISNRYAQELRAIAEEHAEEGVRGTLVYATPGLAAERAQEHAASFGLPFEVMLDPEHELVRRLGAAATSEAVVIDREGRQRYQGRIDDRFLDFGKARARATQHDLRNALADVLAGREVAVPRTRAVGCFLDPLSDGQPPAAAEHDGHG